jgi:hypothetical protein
MFEKMRLVISSRLLISSGRKNLHDRLDTSTYSTAVNSLIAEENFSVLYCVPGKNVHESEVESFDNFHSLELDFKCS